MAQDEAQAAGTEKILSVAGLAKSFGHRPAVIDVTFDLSPTEALGFVGPNGAGKTTTLRMLAGLLKPERGSGHVLGCDITRGGASIAPQVGYMPQRLALYGELSVAENLRFRADVYGLRDPRRAVEAAMDDFDLTPFRSQRAANLSGGWARRLQLAAALIHQPRLALLDEPTAGLDADSRQDVWRRISALARRGASVIINTHDLAEAEQCSRVALFSRGRVLALGAPEALIDDAPFEAALVASADAHVAAHRFEAMEEVIATYPQGQRLRILIEPGASAAVRKRADEAGLALEETPKRLEDAAFVRVRQSLAGIATP